MALADSAKSRILTCGRERKTWSHLELGNCVLKMNVVSMSARSNVGVDEMSIIKGANRLHPLRSYGRILVAFLYVASRRNYLRHFIGALRSQFWDFVKIFDTGL